MMDLIQVTTEYSNAVLVALLPYVSEFSRNLDLPVTIPVTTNQVAEFRCSPYKDRIGGRITLTNGYAFVFDHGAISSFESPHCYSCLQDPDQVPSFYGKLRLNSEEAIGLARSYLSKLGYKDQSIQLSNPMVTPPPIIFRTNTVPHYRIKWLNPAWPKDQNVPMVEVEVNGDKRRIEQIQLVGTNFYRSNPAVNVQVKSSQQQSELHGGIKLSPVTAAQSNALLKAVLPELSSFASKLNLPVNLPIASDHITNSYVGLLGDTPSIQITLQNGYRFNFWDGYVKSFHAPNCFFTFDWQDGKRTSREFEAFIKVSEEEAVSTLRRALQKLGYSEKMLYADRPPKAVGGPGKGNKYGVARYFYQWDAPAEAGGNSIVNGEVDAVSGRLMSLYIESDKLKRTKQK